MSAAHTHGCIWCYGVFACVCDRPDYSLDRFCSQDHLDSWKARGRSHKIWFGTIGAMKA